MPQHTSNQTQPTIQVKPTTHPQVEHPLSTIVPQGIAMAASRPPQPLGADLRSSSAKLGQSSRNDRAEMLSLFSVGFQVVERCARPCIL